MIMTAATMLNTPRTYMGRVKDPLQHHQRHIVQLLQVW